MASDTGSEQDDSTHPSQILRTRVLSWSPWKNRMNTTLYTWLPWRRESGRKMSHDYHVITKITNNCEAVLLPLSPPPRLTVVGSSRGSSIPACRRNTFPRHALHSTRSKAGSRSRAITPVTKLGTKGVGVGKNYKIGAFQNHAPSIQFYPSILIYLP